MIALVTADEKSVVWRRGTGIEESMGNDTVLSLLLTTEGIYICTVHVGLSRLRGGLIRRFADRVTVSD